MWKKVGQKLVLELTLGSFDEAIALVNKIAKIANELDHHPNLKIYDYKKLRIETTTHDQGKITQKDYELTSKIDSILKQ